MTQTGNSLKTFMEIATLQYFHNQYESESEVAQSCPTLCDPVDCSLRGSSVHGIFLGKDTGVGFHFFLQYPNVLI